MNKLTIQELAEKMRVAIQAEATKIPDFDYGAIRLLFVPKCEKANEFIGGFGIGCEVDLGYSIKEGGEKTRPAKDDQKECACYGYAALKIEGCSHALRNGYGQRSSDMPEEFETWGRTNDGGCVVYEIFITERFGICDNSPPALYFRLYVSVSGATSSEDERCALVAGDILQQWCDTELDDDGYGHFKKYLSLAKPK